MKRFIVTKCIISGILALGLFLCLAFSKYNPLVSIVIAICLIAFAVLFFFFFKLSSGKNIADFRLIRFTGKLKKQLKSASTVYIMGHKFSDLDSVGAAYGLYFALRNTYNVKMVVNKQNTLARPLIDFLRFTDKDCEIFDYNEIAHTVDENSLLIIVDTHRPVIMDYPELYEEVQNVIIIDHHRKANDFVDQTVANYIKSSASSACEIVTQIIRLLGVQKLATVAATALLSGVMLDTKNFVMNTSAQTFKAASFLRQNRADPVLIKKMFSESVDVCKRKYEIISGVELFENFAIAQTKSQDKFTRIATAQAADELLGINGVFASFVLCPSEDKVNISARSFGDVDVQKIMAKLGGGGHKTVAACQLETLDFEKARTLLIKAIKEYIEQK